MEKQTLPHFPEKENNICKAVSMASTEFSMK